MYLMKGPWSEMVGQSRQGQFEGNFCPQEVRRNDLFTVPRSAS